MAEEIKFTEEEMTTLRSLQQTYAGVQNALGQFCVEKIRLNQQLTGLDSAEENLTTQFEETQGKERDFVQEISKKYGDGNLDITSGVFTPRPEPVTTDDASEPVKDSKSAKTL